MDNTPPLEDADKWPEVDATPFVQPGIGPPRRPNQRTRVNVADEFPSVPEVFNVSLGLQDAAYQFSDVNVLGSRSFHDNRSIEHSPNTEAGTSHNVNDVNNASEAGPLNTADREQPAANGSIEEPAPSSSKRRCPLFRSSSPPPKRRWDSNPIPSLDPPDLGQDVIAAAEQPQLPIEQDYPEPVDEQYINAQNGTAEVASNYIFISTTHYSSNRFLPFHFHDDRYFSGRIDITGFENVPIIVWPSEIHMEFISEASANNANDEFYHCVSGVITFPAAINLQHFICWIDGNYLYFQAMTL